MAVISLCVLVACGDRTGQGNGGDRSEGDVLVAPVGDDGVPLVVQRVAVVGDGAGDRALVGVVRAMVWKRVNERPDLEWMEYQADATADVCVVVGGDRNVIADVAQRAGAVVLVGDGLGDGAPVVARVSSDVDLAAGQTGEAIWAAADGEGRVVMAPVLVDYPRAQRRIEKVQEYLQRATPERASEELELHFETEGVESHAQCEAWLNDALGMRVSDGELSAVVAVTRNATEDVLRRMRAIGLAEAVPVIGFGLDVDVASAMDDGEIVGTFVYDPGTLEACLRVALDHAAGVKLGGPTNALEDQLVPLRWLDHQRLGSADGRAIATPYLEAR
ncbi:substrate-binding domain-containing protein [Sulfuriroseicoccus oceanibius]|uniref:Substrate-binding domain-containing protein n=1 Tax=Sulfuriroseicoccus oceanibius TaxID=2707525 RepID=A0A6B3LAQ1_9BACT|nr:substrate-binding domain-containing protein [Sulfuriroseicoccus oceanibius]QQL45540.1 substrate-binding domain-containing protein [Sulfuriroseicoccus oceanibius]